MLAEEISARKPAVCAVTEIAAGDALAMATRFDAGWAYRGSLALFWENAFVAHEVHDRYLPVPMLINPFERRGLLEVRGEREGRALTLVAVALSTDRERIRELRFLRTALRKIAGDVVLFVANASGCFSDLGFTTQREDRGNAVLIKS